MLLLVLMFMLMLMPIPRTISYLKELGQECGESWDEEVVERGAERDEHEDGVPEDEFDGRGQILQGMPEVRRLRDLFCPVSMGKV